jgi:transposase
MHMPQSEKMEVIRLVESSELPVCQTLQQLGITRSTFYTWYEAYRKAGYDGLAPQRASGRRARYWNQY